jgi:hypothetical protein
MLCSLLLGLMPNSPQACPWMPADSSPSSTAPANENHFGATVTGEEHVPSDLLPQPAQMPSCQHDGSLASAGASLRIEPLTMIPPLSSFPARSGP